MMRSVSAREAALSSERVFFFLFPIVFLQEIEDSVHALADVEQHFHDRDDVFPI